MVMAMGSMFVIHDESEDIGDRLRSKIVSDIEDVLSKYMASPDDDVCITKESCTLMCAMQAVLGAVLSCRRTLTTGVWEMIDTTCGK